tara:strand:+ start:960 stop:1418 length:459 start_codon:yes stop_codon:yes gene_type:complete
MNFENVQSNYKTRMDADDWFVANGVVARLSKSAKIEDVDLINDEIEGDLRNTGMAFVIKAPRLKEGDSTRSGRAILYSVVDVVILENPEVNRKSTGINATGVKAAVETIMALLGHSQIRLDPGENVYQEVEGPSGLIAYVVRTIAICDIWAR